MPVQKSVLCCRGGFSPNKTGSREAYNAVILYTAAVAWAIELTKAAILL